MSSAEIMKTQVFYEPEKMLLEEKRIPIPDAEELQRRRQDPTVRSGTILVENRIVL